MTPSSGPPAAAGARGPAPRSPRRPRPEPTADPTVEPVVDTRRGRALDPVAEAPNETVVDDLDDLLFAARRERDEFLDLAQRVQADFENYKKRMLRQQTDHLERAAEDLVTKVLPVLDAFDLARAHLGEGDDALARGQGPRGRLDAARRHRWPARASSASATPGEPFDPTTHEAVDRVNADHRRCHGAGADRGRCERPGHRRGAARRVPVEGTGDPPGHGAGAGVMVAQREWLDKDYYQVLGVASTATDKEITRAYRKLAKQFHPDANPGSEDRFKEISAAYDVLGDDAKRKEYDEVPAPRARPASAASAAPAARADAGGAHLPGRGPR